AEFAMTEVTKAIAAVTGISREHYNSVKITEQGPTGRAETFQFDNVAVGAQALRLALGGEKMKSNLIEEIAVRGDILYVKGKGYGHGVGMSQWGARVLAEQGKSAEAIIQYFFRDIKIIETE
ncbi:MAG: stage II sporulation protein SpoIID, partial [Peptococcaceae bacterium]|nr:stage II sporulation protein SpoIID [Peptococcaceae bacterium]